jgi:uncharacterized membrane protein
MDAEIQLLFHWIPIVLGLSMFTPLGAKIAPLFAKIWPSAISHRGKLLTGTLLIMLGGFTVSVHTLWIHNKALEFGAGSFCASGGVWDCSSVIGNDEWNVDPVFGLPWGILGMLSFAALMWLILSVARDPNSTWVRTNLRIARFIGVSGVFIIFYLIYAEFSIGKLCQYCTTAHFAHVFGLVGSVLLLKAYDENNWTDESDVLEGDDNVERRGRKQGYVAPIHITPGSNEEE